LSEFRYATRGRAQREAILKTFQEEGQAAVAFDKTAEKTYEAWDMMFRGEVEGARALAQEVLVIEGENIGALNVLGEAALLSGDLKLAEDFLLKAVNATETTKPPEGGEPGEVLTRMHWTMGFFHTLESIAALLVESGEYDQAIEVLERLPATAFPYLPWSALVLMRLYTVKRNPQKALAALRNCQNFRFPGTAYDAALCQIILGDGSRAAQALREGFFQSPYIACEIIGEPAPAEVRCGAPDETDGQMKEVARRYMNQMRATWESVPGAIEFVRNLWNHPEVKSETYEYCKLTESQADGAGGKVEKDAVARLTELLNPGRVKSTSVKIVAEIGPLPPQDAKPFEAEE